MSERRRRSEGQPASIGVVIDIAERKRAETALNASRRLIEGILNTIPVRVFWKDKNLVYLGCNAGFARDAGFSLPEEIVGKDDYQLGWRDQAELYRSGDREVIESGRSKLLIEEPQTAPNGETITLLTSKIPLLGENGAIEGVLGTYQDITERKRAEEDLRISEERFRLVIEQAPDAILLYDADKRRFVSANRAAERLFACARGEIIKHGPQHFYPPEQPDAEPITQSFAEHNKRALAGEEITYERRILNTLGQERLCQVTLVRLPPTNPRLLRSSFVDITGRREAERALRRLNRTLRTLSRGNEVLVRAAGEPELLREMCRVIVETGGYRMAWIGVAQHDAAKSVIPVASAGEVGDYLDKAKITWADEPRGRGMVGRAIRSGEPQTSQNLTADPGMIPWREEARKHGFACSVALPLKDRSEVFGVLTMYAAEPDAFDADELNLLQELANDLAFGIRSLREHIAREDLDKRWQASLEATVGAIANTVEMRDPYTAGHQQRVARLAMAIARALQLSEQQIRGLYLAGVIHDVGKIDIPGEILNKPGKLSKLQFQLIQAHAQSGYEIIKGVDFPWPIAEMVRQHHERLDGSGYPQGLKADAILPEAKILAVADVVEAMMSHRPYRSSLGIDAALEEIQKGKARIYDAPAVEACVALFREKRFSFE